MRQGKQLTALMITLLLLLTSCGRSVQDKALEIRTDFINAYKLNAEMDITADFGQTVSEFSLSYCGDMSGGTVTITAPEALAGISAYLCTDDCTLSYNGIDFPSGKLLGDLSPASAMGILTAEWSKGYVISTSEETVNDTDTICISTRRSDTVTQSTWFDTETKTPLIAEIYENGRMVIKCAFRSFNLQ